MAEEPDILGQADTAWLRIDSHSGRVVACNATAAELLGAGSTGLEGRPWRDCLGNIDCAEQLAGGLSRAIRTPLAPFILHRPTSGDIALGGMLVPLGEDGLLLLWPLLEAQTLGLPADLTPGEIRMLELILTDETGATDTLPERAAAQPGPGDEAPPAEGEAAEEPAEGAE